MLFAFENCLFFTVLPAQMEVFHNNLIATLFTVWVKGARKCGRGLSAFCSSCSSSNDFCASTTVALTGTLCASPQVELLLEAPEILPETRE